MRAARGFSGGMRGAKEQDVPEEGREEKLRELYSQWQDEVLIRALIEDREEYEEIALRLMKEELQHRGVDVEDLKARWQKWKDKIAEAERAQDAAKGEWEEPPTFLPETGGEDALVAAKVYINEMDANLARGLLEANGIPAAVFADDCGGQTPFQQVTEGIRLMVSKEDLESARELLASL